MSTTTYFSITLPGENSQDWMTLLHAALSTITEKIVRTQLPAGTTLRWGDIAGGKYLEATSAGVRVIGGLDCGATATKNLRVEQGNSFPVSPAAGMLFLRTDENILYFRNAANSAWIAVGSVDAEGIAAGGGLVLTDLGATKGSFAAASGAGGIVNPAPGADRTVLSSSAASGTGWALATVFNLIGYSLTKGQLVAGGDANATQALDPGANGTLLVADDTAAAGVAWKTLLSRLATLLTARGQLLAGGAANPQVVAAPESDDRVLVSDAAEDGGVRWAAQSELGAIPGTRTRVAGDLYLYANFI